MTEIKIGVQLWTLRRECERDFLGTLRAVAEAGYRWIEPFQFHAVSAPDLAGALKNLRLGVLSSHVALDRLETDLERVIAEHETLGCRNLVCPWLPEQRRSGPGAFEKVGKILDGIGARLVERGFSLAYHNHDFEFTAVQKPDGLERILGQSDARHLSVQLDTYWVAYAGLDPVRYVRGLGGRLASIHLKDGEPTAGTFTPVGSGQLDMPAILRTALAQGVATFIVEQDECGASPLESIRLSLDFLRGQGLLGQPIQ